MADGYALHTWDDLLGVVPGVFGVKTGHTSTAGWNQVAAVRGDGTTIYATILGSPSRGATQRRPRDAARLRPRAVPAGRRRRPPAGAYAQVELPYGRSPLALVGVGAAPGGRAGRTSR